MEKVFKIGIVANDDSLKKRVSNVFIESEEFQIIYVPHFNRQVEFIKRNKIDALIVSYPVFSSSVYKSVQKLAKLINDIPIVIAGNEIENVVRDNLGFMGRVNYVNLNDGISELPFVVDCLLHQSEIITRRHLRHQTNTRTAGKNKLTDLSITILDLSVGGARLLIPDGDLEVDEKLLLTIPRGSRKPLEVYAKVVRIDRTPDSESWDQVIGVEFSHLGNKEDAA